MTARKSTSAEPTAVAAEQAAAALALLQSETIKRVGFFGGEFAANERVAHVPTLNVGVISSILDGGLAEINWTSGGSTGSSVVPLAELVHNPSGATTNEDVAAVVASAANAAAAETDEQREQRHHAKDVRDADHAAQLASEAKTTARARRRSSTTATDTPAETPKPKRPTNAERLAAIGETPGNARDRKRFAELRAAAQTSVRAAAAKLYDGERTVARCWAEALDAAPESAKRTPVDVEFLLDRHGNFRVHRAGCADVPREIKREGNYDQPGTATFADQLGGVRWLWDDQIREAYDGDGEPPVEWLVAHSYVSTVVYVPCVRRSLDAIPGVDAARAVRDTNRHGEVAGYVLIKSRNEFDQFRAIEPSADRPEWLTRCNAHGTTSTWPSRNASRWNGWVARRVEWCAPCKSDADAKSAAGDATAEHDAAVKSDAEPTPTPRRRRSPRAEREAALVAAKVEQIAAELASETEPPTPAE
jgi:hypothetical protein